MPSIVALPHLASLTSSSIRNDVYRQYLALLFCILGLWLWSIAPATAANSLTGTLAAGNDAFHPLTVPVGQRGLRVVLSATGSADLYLYRDHPAPTPDVKISESDNSRLHTLHVPEADLSPGDAYYVQIHAAVGLSYTLSWEWVYAHDLSWDSGATATGATGFDQPDTFGGDYLVRITSQTSSNGVWRHVLAVSSGEADLSLMQGSPPTGTNEGTYSSNRTGSDGFVLDDDRFADNQTWYYRVHATPGARWRLVSGDIHVHDLGTLTSDGSSGSGTVSIGPEGIVYFKTAVDSATQAWRLWLHGTALPILVQKNTAPTSANNEQNAQGQMLLVPNYLTNDLYFVGVPGTPGTALALDSRKQAITPLAFGGSVTGTVVGGYGFVTYRVDVPVEQIAWEVLVTPSSGNPQLYVRQGQVPNQWNNDGLSEAPGLVADSVTQVPPTLTNGAWYITVYGTGSFSYTLANKNPDIPVIAFINSPTSVINDALHQNRAGWRYYRVDNIAEQLRYFGWELELAGQQPGTEIAVRRNAVPSRWQYRSDDNPAIATGSHLDASSTIGLLQRPRHQADVWYIGIYHPDQALGAFQLETRGILTPGVAFNGGAAVVAGQEAATWRFFQMVVPADTMGWDLRLEQVTSGQPGLVVCRNVLPSGFETTNYIWQGADWPSGHCWSAGNDWTGRQHSASGEDERYRVLAMGMGSPLEAGTYYIGVSGAPTGTGDPLSYTLRSRGIGMGEDSQGVPWAIQVQDLGAFTGGTASGSGLAPREAAYYRLTVPEGQSSWSLELAPTLGEALLAVRQGKLPNITAGGWASDHLGYNEGTARNKPGQEFFYKYADHGETTITPGDYYLAVVSEGQDPVDGAVGTGPVSYTLTSQGLMPVSAQMGELPVKWMDPDPVYGRQSADYGQQKAYRFRIPAGLTALEIRLRDRVGNPLMTLYRGEVGAGLLPSSYADYPAEEGGQSPDARGAELITLAQPMAGDYTLLVAAASDGTNAQIDAGYDVEVTAQRESVFGFNGGTAVVTDQEAATWRFFQMVVPADAMGWDLRLEQVTSGQPGLVVCRDVLPSGFETTPSIWAGAEWPSGHCWSAGNDWTGRQFSASGEYEVYRILAMGMGSPLEAGTYYIGVSGVPTGTGDPLSYTLHSRGIGMGADSQGVPWAIQIQELGSFTGGTASGSGLAPREAAYYRLTVPAGQSSWSLDLAPTLGEALLAVRQGKLPNITAGGWASDHLGYNEGTARQKPGQEFFYKYADQGETTITPGDYYLAVVSEGQDPVDGAVGTGPVSYTLTSQGAMPVSDKTAAPLSLNAPVEWLGEGAVYGQQKAYRFRVPAGLTALEIRLRDRVGNPLMTLYRGEVGAGLLPSSYADYPAEEGGQSPDARGAELITLAQPVAGDYTLLVAAASDGTNAQIDAGYDVEVTAQRESVFGFNGGTAVVTDQEAATWRFFQMVVPADAMGWDLRLEQVTSGQPGLVVCRDVLPSGFETSGSIWAGAEWPSGHCWSAGNDWTGRQFSASGEYEVYRILAMGMGSPLEAGTYYIGVSGVPTGTGDPLSYTLHSRGIGMGEDSQDVPWAIQVQDLGAFTGGTASGSGLAPREAAYYRLTVPAGQSSWSLDLAPTLGEALLAVRQGKLPNITAATRENGGTQSDNAGWNQGALRQKPGQEFFYKYANHGETTITPGDYYLAVVSEGQDPVDVAVGTGPASYTLTSQGLMPVSDKTATPLSLNAPVEWLGEGAVYGQQKAYRFRVPAGLTALEIRLRNRVGNPLMTVYRGEVGAGLLPWSDARSSFDYPAEEGGQSPNASGAELITLAQPVAGDYTLLVAANSDDYRTPVDAGYDISVAVLQPQNLAASGGQSSGSLVNNQSAFFQVDVPTGTVGWRLWLYETIGDATLSVRKDGVPNGDGETLSSSTVETLLTAPYLTPGTWFVEVKANGLTEYQLLSTVLQPERTWNMPPAVLTNPGNLPDPWAAATHPGLSAPQIGDSGIDAEGDPIVNPNTGDQGTDLAEGHFHYYRVVVPEDNAGLLRTTLVALSGDVDLYLRAGHPPTLNHDDGYQGWSGALFDRHHTGDATGYGSWVPLDARVGAYLPPGDWWLAVQANGTNVRYRLTVGAGGIEDEQGDLFDEAQFVRDLAQSGGAVTDQTLAAGDMRYYRVHVPASSTNQASSTPLDWTLRLTKQHGDVRVFIRDRVAPGNSDADGATSLCSDESLAADWGDDNSHLPNAPYIYLDEPVSYTLKMPPVKAGKTYYLGAYACNDATFSLRSTVGADRLKLDGVLDFYHGTVTTTLAAGQKRLYKIPVPVEGVRWRHLALNGAAVTLYLMQDTVPVEGDSAHWYSCGANAGYTQRLDDASYPWQPGHDYYLLMVNTGPAPESVTFTMDGRNALTIDEDEDGVPDVIDNCPALANPDQTDVDRDGIGDACDSLIDSDGDGVAEDIDNCPNVANPDQRDSDGNGVGDACEDFCWACLPSRGGWRAIIK